MSKGVRSLLWIGGGVVLSLLVAWSQGLFSAESAADALRCLSDGFFVTAALFLTCGGLRWCTNGGAVDGLGYACKTLIQRVRFSYEEHRETFGEYRENRAKKARSPRSTLLYGTVFLVVAVLFFAAYYAVK